MHTVGGAETLRGIVADYGVTLGDLIRANPDIADPDVIRVGQRIYLPAIAERSRPAIDPPPEAWNDDV